MDEEMELFYTALIIIIFLTAIILFLYLSSLYSNIYDYVLEENNKNPIIILKGDKMIF